LFLGKTVTILPSVRPIHHSEDRLLSPSINTSIVVPIIARFFFSEMARCNSTSRVARSDFTVSGTSSLSFRAAIVFLRSEYLKT